MATRSIDGARCFQTMVPMRDGARLNTFVFLPEQDRAPMPVIVHRTPYGITSPQGDDITDPAKGWLPDPAAPLRGSILRGWREPSWLTGTPRSTRTAEAATAPRARITCTATTPTTASTRSSGSPRSRGRTVGSGCRARRPGRPPPSPPPRRATRRVQAFFAQVGGSSIYDDVVYEGQSIELERLWLWVANNIAGSVGHPPRRGAGAQRARRRRSWSAVAALGPRAATGARRRPPPTSALRRHAGVDAPAAARLSRTSRSGSPTSTSSSATRRPTTFRARHDFRSTIDVPGFHVTTWFDIFLTSVLAAFQEIQARVGNQRLWIGPNDHYFVYERQFWARDPYFEWFDHWLKGERDARSSTSPPCFYSPRCWVDDPAGYLPDDWRHAEHVAASRREPQRLYLRGDGALDAARSRAANRRPLPLRPAPSGADAGWSQHAHHGGRPRPAPGAGHRGLRAHLP